MKRFLLVSVLFFFAFGAIYAAYNPFEMEPRKDSDAAKLKRENEQLRRQVEALKKQVEGLKRRLESPREPQREPFPHQSEHLRRQPQERQEVDRDWFRRSMEQRQMLRKLEWLRDNFRRLNDAQRERVLKMLKEKMGPERAKEFLKRIERMRKQEHPLPREGFCRPLPKSEKREKERFNLREFLRNHLMELLKRLPERKHPFGPEESDSPRWF